MKIIMRTLKFSEDPTDITLDLTGQISQCHNLQLCRWANRKVGAIVPVRGSLTLYFSEVLSDSSRNDIRMDFEPEYGKEWDNPDLDSHIVSYGGIVAQWLIGSRGLLSDSHGIALLNDPNFRANMLHTLKEEPFLDTLYDAHFETAQANARMIFESLQNERRKKPGAWKRENKEFVFSMEEHIKEELRMLWYDERHLYPFFRQEDVEFMRAIAQDYQKYIQYKINTQPTDVPPPSSDHEEKNPKGKKPKEEELFEPTTDTFKIENTTTERLQQVFQLCTDRKWLDENTRVDDWLKLFANISSNVIMVWDYNARPALRDLFKMMAYDKDGEQKSFISPRRGYLRIVSSHFVSEKPTPNKPYAYITNFDCRHRKGDKQSIEYCRRLLKGEDIDKIIFEMVKEQQKAEEKKKAEALNNESVIDQVQPDNIIINEDTAAQQQGQHTPRKAIRSPKY